MNITFASSKLRKLVHDDRKMNAQLGKLRADILRHRLSQMQDATTLEDVRYLPGKHHELLHDRKGQWGCDLDHPYRLIYVPHEQPIPINDDGQFIWSEITGVTIVEVINYHKEQ